MERIELKLSEIAFEKSKYRFIQNRDLDEYETKEKSLWNSLQAVGMQSPLIVIKDSEGKYHLIDGFCRYKFAQENGIDSIAVDVLDEKISNEEVAGFIMSSYMNRISSSVVTKYLFVEMLLSIGVSKKFICEEVLSQIGLESHEMLIRKLRSLSNLSWEILLFCHEKNLSLKQCQSLIHVPEEIRTQIFSWRTMLSLTVSLVDEFASGIRDYCRTHQCSLADFLAETEVQNVLNADLNPQEKTKQLREVIRIKRYPVSTRMNADIESVVNALNLPNKMKLLWDRTLEIKELRVHFSFKNISELKKCTDRLISDDFAAACQKTLDRY